MFGGGLIPNHLYIIYQILTVENSIDGEDLIDQEHSDSLEALVCTFKQAAEAHN